MQCIISCHPFIMDLCKFNLLSWFSIQKTIYYLDYTFDLTNRVDIDRSVGPTIFCNFVQIHTFLSIDYIWIFIINTMNLRINSAIKKIIFSYDMIQIRFFFFDKLIQIGFKKYDLNQSLYKSSKFKLITNCQSGQHLVVVQDYKCTTKLWIKILQLFQPSTS